MYIYIYTYTYIYTLTSPIITQHNSIKSPEAQERCCLLDRAVYGHLRGWSALWKLLRMRGWKSAHTEPLEGTAWFGSDLPTTESLISVGLEWKETTGHFIGQLCRHFPILSSAASCDQRQQLFIPFVFDAPLVICSKCFQIMPNFLFYPGSGMLIFNPRKT